MRDRRESKLTPGPLSVPAGQTDCAPDHIVSTAGPHHQSSSRPNAGPLLRFCPSSCQSVAVRRTNQRRAGAVTGNTRNTGLPCPFPSRQPSPPFIHSSTPPSSLFPSSTNRPFPHALQKYPPSATLQTPNAVVATLPNEPHPNKTHRGPNAWGAMFDSKSLAFAVGLIALLCFVHPTLAFGAGNIASISKIEGQNCAYRPRSASLVAAPRAPSRSSNRG